MKISVVITAYNYGRFLDRCIGSLWAQTFPRQDFEIIVVDDHSSDDTPGRTRQYATQGIRVFRNDRNLGVAASANRGIQAAHGELVVRVDADDFVAPRFLSRLEAGLRAAPGALGCACDYQWVDDLGRMLEFRSAQAHPIACGVLFRREALLALGAYNPDFRHMESEELRLRFGEAYQVVYLNDPLYSYRRHDTNQTLATAERAVFRKKIAKMQEA